MPVTKATGTKTSTKAIKLNFDPRYVEWTILTWLAMDLAMMKLDTLTQAVAAYAEDQLAELNAVGLPDEEVSADAIAKAITLLETLALLSKKKVSPRPMKSARGPKAIQQTPADVLPVVPAYYEIAPTTEGHEVFTMPPLTGAVRSDLVRRIVAQSPDLTALMVALNTEGPLIRPVRSLSPLAPTRGAAYTNAVEEGIKEFSTQYLRESGMLSGDAKARRPTSAKLIENAVATALKRHSLGMIKQLDKLLPLATILGLVWMDTVRVNEVIGAQYLGSAADHVGNGFVPHTPSWERVRSKIAEELVRAYRTRADSTGFATVDELRGAIGSALHLSPPVVDALLRDARLAGDRHEIPVALQFEPDEALIYATDRHPLLWKGHAYDLVLLSLTPSSVRI